MHVRVRNRLALLAGCGVLAVAALSGRAQGAVGAEQGSAALLPEAPAPQLAMAIGRGSAPQDAHPGAGASSATQPPSGAQPSNSGSKADDQAKAEARRREAEQELKAEEKQRILGVAPNFGTSYVWNAASLSPGQKMQLAFRSAVDPFTFAAAGLVAGLHEALDDDPGFGWGAAGYGKRAGAAYLDALDGDLIGNGFLPVILHQDPRFFRLGHGTFTHRLLYAIAASYICRGDNGKWQPNFSNVGGNIIAGAISNLYYPAEESGWGQTITNGLIVTTEGTAGGVFDEFWPDISRKFLHHNGASATVPQPVVQPR